MGNNGQCNRNNVKERNFVGWSSFKFLIKNKKGQSVSDIDCPNY